MTARTFPELLADQVRRSGSRPLVTFYDDATGERVELSVVTYANWVAKTAGVLADEVDLERGSTVLVDLPTHWLAPVWLGACWTLGAAVTAQPTAESAVDHDLVVCGPHDVERYAASGRPVVALSLLPMGRRFAEPLPDGVVDFGVVVWGQPDAFLALDPPAATDVAWRGTSTRTHADLLTTAASGDRWTAAGTRLLTDLAATSEEGLDAFLAPLAAGGGTVWVAHPDPDGWEHRAETEQATAVLRTAAS